MSKKNWGKCHVPPSVVFLIEKNKPCMYRHGGSMFGGSSKTSQLLFQKTTQSLPLGGGIKVDKSNYWREIFCWNTWSILKNAGEILDGIFLFTIFHENSCQVSTFRPVIIPFNILPSTGGMQLCDQEERWGKKMMPSAPDQFGSFFCRPPPWGGGSGQNPIATSHPWMCG